MGKKKRKIIIGARRNPKTKSKGIWEKITNFFSSKRGIAITSIVSLLSILLAINWEKIFLSQHERDKRSRTIKGILVPNEILDSNISIKYAVLDSTFFALNPKRIKSGIPFYINQILCKHEDSLGGFNEQSVNLKVVIKNKRLYVIDTIRYFLNEEVVGIIDQNHWSLFNGQYLDYYSDDKSLEVIDRQGMVALSLTFLDSETLYFKGYFIGQHYLTVFGKDLFICLSKNNPSYRQEALDAIKTNVPRFNY